MASRSRRSFRIAARISRCAALQPRRWKTRREDFIQRGAGTQDIGFRNEADVLFDCIPARELVLRVLDENDQPTTAAFLIRDAQKRIYPSIAKRLAPDFAFHQQIYRSDGETLKLPDGAYTISLSRAPKASARNTRSQFPSRAKPRPSKRNAGSIHRSSGLVVPGIIIFTRRLCALCQADRRVCTRRT